jgi:1-aminocyclopropane-1-carboxylate deaminase/D-cysteine desulfhydrase-like pyridoxal-dependent ACC family enzyme
MKMSSLSKKQLKAKIDSLPRVNIALLPTPLQEAPRLSKELGVRILIKRDDLTGLAMGGNKVRHMDFCMADAIEKEADVSLNINPWMSNNARIIGAASKIVGLDYINVAPASKLRPIQGNLLIQDILGTDLHLLDTSDHKKVNEYVDKLETKLIEQGKSVYNHVKEHMSRSSATISYMEATLEIDQQLEDHEFVENLEVFIASGGAQGGLMLASQALNLPWNVHGVIVGKPEESYADVVTWSNNALNHLGFSERLDWSEVEQLDKYIGPGYAIPGEDCIEAIRMVAELEGILLDPVYTGKVMAAVIDYARNGKFNEQDTVLFIHTGGLPELFDFAEELKRRDYI